MRVFAKQAWSTRTLLLCLVCLCLLQVLLLICRVLPRFGECLFSLSEHKLPLCLFVFALRALAEVREHRQALLFWGV